MTFMSSLGHEWLAGSDPRRHQKISRLSLREFAHRSLMDRQLFQYFNSQAPAGACFSEAVANSLMPLSMSATLRLA